MFKVSQEIRLNTASGGGGGGVGGIVASSGSHIGDITRHHLNSTNSNNCETENDFLFGKYQRTPDADAYPVNVNRVFVAPELTNPSKVQLLHFPNGAVRLNSDVDFIIKRNGVKGNFEVKVESPSGNMAAVPLQFLDPERFKVAFNLNQPGLYKVHIKCNSVELPKSPFIIVSICGEIESTKVQLPDFKSDATKVNCRGLGLSHISLSDRNEFTVDGSEAGNNILFVGIFGPSGQCDEVVIKHLGKNIYRVTYQVQDPGDYVLAAKWGDDQIPGSPFYLSTM